MNASQSYYVILGVAKNATAKQIRERFLQLARDRHPDRFADDEKETAEIEFQRITQAYNVLHDAERRRLYDQEQELKSRAPSHSAGNEAAKVYLRRGVEAFKKKRYQEAVTNLEQATQEDSKDPQAWYYLAQVYAQRTAWISRGLAAASKACELDSTNSAYLKLAGQLAAQTGLHNRALKYYRDALTFGGEDGEIRAALKSLKKQGS